MTVRARFRVRIRARGRALGTARCVRARWPLAKRLPWLWPIRALLPWLWPCSGPLCNPAAVPVPESSYKKSVCFSPPPPPVDSLMRLARSGSWLPTLRVRVRVRGRVRGRVRVRVSVSVSVRVRFSVRVRIS